MRTFMMSLTAFVALSLVSATSQAERLSNEEVNVIGFGYILEGQRKPHVQFEWGHVYPCTTYAGIIGITQKGIYCAQERYAQVTSGVKIEVLGEQDDTIGDPLPAPKQYDFTAFRIARFNGLTTVWLKAVVAK